MALTFEWHESKAWENIKKHGVSFEEAKSVFNDPFTLTIYDPDHSITENRYIDIGFSSKSRLIIVSYTERGENIRIISGRPASRKERNNYEEKL